MLAAGGGQWAGGAADGLRGHRCGAGAGAGLLLAGGAGRRGDLLRWWCAGVVIGQAARSSSRAGLLLIRQARQAAGRGRWAKEKGQGRRRGVRCCSGLWSVLAWWAVVVCSPVPVPGRCWRWHCSRRNGSSWQRSSASRAALAVLHPGRFCRLPEGSDSPLYRVVLYV